MKNRFLTYLKNPELIKNLDDDQIQNWLDRYPFSYIFWLLKAKKSKLNGLPSVDEDIHMAALYSPDRAFMQAFLKDEYGETSDDDARFPDEIEADQTMKDKSQEDAQFTEIFEVVTEETLAGENQDDDAGELLLHEEFAKHDLANLSDRAESPQFAVSEGDDQVNFDLPVTNQEEDVSPGDHKTGDGEDSDVRIMHEAGQELQKTAAGSEELEEVMQELSDIENAFDDEMDLPASPVEGDPMAHEDQQIDVDQSEFQRKDSGDDQVDTGGDAIDEEESVNGGEAAIFEDEIDPGLPEFVRWLKKKKVSTDPEPVDEVSGTGDGGPMVDQVGKKKQKKKKRKKEEKGKKGRKKKEKKKKKAKLSKRLRKLERLAQKSLEARESTVSETLAEILNSQGHKDRALQMYEQLLLIFPEKSAYFAAKIEKLKNS